MMPKKARKQFAEDKQTKDMDYWKKCVPTFSLECIYFCADLKHALVRKAFF